MNHTPDGGTDFTSRAWEALYDAVDSRYFRDRDAALIYAALQSRLRFISFGEYLKRYIYRKAALSAPFESVPLKEYQQIIRDSFAEQLTPPSFTPTTAKLSALSKNWLTQHTVSRSVVFLLGFGLSMSAEDVNEFLTKALREQAINPKSPFEVICWYCYKNRFRYPKFERLWQIFLDNKPNSLDMNLLYSDLTIGVQPVMRRIDSDAALLAYLSRWKASNNAPQLSVSARKSFDGLFERAKELVAALYNAEEEAGRSRRTYRGDEITESDLEHIISSAIPLDRHGNLSPGKASRLNAQFAGKRFSRQRISEILAGKAEVTRFDLITLQFFIYSQTLEDFPNIKARYVSFIETTNRILSQCLLGELYIANPYECFVLMCILSEDPLGTYADVWELSYRNDSGED